MSSSSQKSSNPKEETKPNSSTATSLDPVPNCDTAETAALNGDQSNKPSIQQDSLNKIITKKVKIVDPGPAHEVESDDEDSLSQAGSLDRTGSTGIGEAAPMLASGQPTDLQTIAAAAERKKTKEERKKEREKKKEEEMLKKYQAEQEAKQRVSAKSKCGRWIKHNLKIGEGGYKFVYRGYDTVEARNVAWCEFKREHVDTKEKRQQMFKETEIMLKMNHPHIVRCFDVFREWIDMEDPNNQIEEKGVVIIQELMGEGTLKSVIRKNFLEGQCILKFPLITRWWHQILDALRYMHHKIQPPILHRDLKADNCFLYGASDEEYLNVKVGDFGLATHVNNSGRKTMLGTLGFMAPEIFDEKYDEKVDIYAFGMLMLEVMTNRTPYDECETVMQVAAKTMSGQGPDIMDKVLNPSLREVISACIQPLTCFRPSAEELYFHPLFQRYQEGDDSWPKTLPVEVEPNYDNATDRAEVLDRFVRSLDVAETRNPNFNLRLRFRDKKMLQELGLDDGESLEFDLDIYKAEDQDIPDLIHNLRLGYEDKLWRVFENPKQPDKKIVSSHLDKLFNSIRLQMQFLVKVLLGKRWKAILDSLVDEPRVSRKKDGQSALDEDDDSDTDGRETSSFTIIGKYKGKWSRAKRLLDREIQAYRNATAGHPLTSNPANVGPKVAAVPASTPNMPTSLQSDAAVSGGTLTPNVHPPVYPNTIPIPTSNVQTSVPETVEPSSMHSNVATIGKFSISTPPSASGAPPAVSQSTIQAQAAQLPPETGQTPPVAEHVGLQPYPSNEANIYQTTAQGSVSTAVQNPNPESGLIPVRLHPDQNVTQLPIMQTPLSVNPITGHPFSGNQIPPMTTPQPQASHLPSLPTSTKTDSESVAAVDLDSVARSALLLQQVLQGISVPPLKPFSEGSAAQTGPNSPAYSSSVAQPSQFLNQLQQQQTMMAPQTQQSVLTDGATAPVAISPATAGSGSIPSHYISPEALIQSLTAGLLGSTTPEMQQLQQPFVQSSSTQGLSSSISVGQIATGASAIPITDQQALLASSMRGQPPVLGGSDVAPQPDLDAAVKVEPFRHDAGQPSVLLNQLTEALLGVATGTAGTPASAFGLQPTQQQALLQTLINQQAGQQQQLAQLGSATSNKQPSLQNTSVFETGTKLQHPVRQSSYLSVDHHSYPCAKSGSLSQLPANETAWYGSDGCLVLASKRRAMNKFRRQCDTAATQQAVSSPAGPRHGTVPAQDPCICRTNTQKLHSPMSPLVRLRASMRRHSSLDPSMSMGHRRDSIPQVALNSMTSILSPLLTNLFPKPSRKPSVPDSDRRVRKKSKPKPRFILRMTKIEKDSEGSEPGSFRPTFYLEMPDLSNPNSEVWKFSFRCNLSDTPDDIKLFKGSGYTATNEEVERAAKEAVVQMLDSLRADVSSVKLNQDYIFYPRPHCSTTNPSFPPVALSEPSSVASSHLAAGIPVTAKSSQTSLNIPSLASRSVASQQLGAVTQPTAIVASSPNPPIPGASLLYDTSAAMANLEEVPPIENTSHFNGLLVQNPLDSTSYARSHPFLSTNFLTGLASSETGRDDDDELGEISRPLSPAEISVPQQLQQFASRQILAPNFDSSIPSTLSFGSAATPYFSASSCGSTGLVSVSSATQHAASFPGTASASFDPSEGIASRQPLLPFGASYLSELLSLAAKHIAQLSSSASGTQASLEEVTPLIPMVSSPSSVACMPPTEILTDVVTTDPAEHVRRELPFDANAFLLSHLNRVSAVGQSQVTTTTTNTGPAVTEPPEQDSFVTLTCTIPASLEAVMREIIHRLCSAPLRSYLLLPSRVTATEEAAQQTVVRLLEIPQNHVFLGVPTSDDQAAPFSLTTFKTSGESAFIVIEGTHGDGRTVSVPRIYRTPVNSAVVLTPNGTVHCLNQASSIIPSLSSELPQRSSPQYSPTADTSDITQLGHASTAAVQPRELPLNMNADTFTLDDVLNLLLALRNSSHQHQRSATTSPTTETYSGVNPVASIEGQHVPSTTSRRSSATGSVHVVPHTNLGKSFAPTPQFSQLQQLSLGRQQRILPIPQHHQLSQTVSTSKPPYIEQAGILSSQLSSGRVSSIPGTVQDVPAAAIFGSQVTGLSKDGAVAASYLTQPFTQANAMSQQSSVTSQPRWTTHERVSATAPPPSGLTSTTGVSHTLHSQQPTSSSTEITAAGLQQALQLLSALNVTGSPEQLSSVLVQLLRNPNLMHSVPVGQSTVPVAASLRNPVTSLGARPCFSGQATLQRISTVSPPVPASGFSATSSITSSNLPTILGRLLTSSVAPTERIVPTETPNLVPSQVTPIAPLPTRLAPLTSSPATVMNASIVDTTGFSHLASSGLQGVATASPHASSQQSLSYSSGQQIRPSHLLTHAEGGHSQQVSVSQSNVQQKVPDLANLLRLIQSQPDPNAVKELLAALPIETQIHLLSALQPHSTRVTGLSGAPVQHPLQTHQPNLASSFTPQPAATNPTSGSAVGLSSINPPAITTASSVQLPRDVTAVPSVGDALQSSSVHHPLPAAPTTVANKFTVVPVKSENDEPAPPTQPVAPTTSQPSAAGTQWNQAPPRPPRQRTGQTAPPPPPPATPNSQLEIEPTGFSPLVTPVGPPASVTSQIASTPGLVTVLPTTSGLGVPVKQIPQNYKSDDSRMVVPSMASNVPAKNLPSVSSRTAATAHAPLGSAIPVANTGTAAIQQIPASFVHVSQPPMVPTASTANPTVSSNTSTGHGP
ncbi:hypothetical protein CRM22_002431 [Opisthorchis felineus]|uniref:Protein kinase domain-containing protein n=1 Tax=Opisthorchis felineus TaxID=147828 RepID=A0A4S2M623_OPIFE|nr:hypothetical protein CRM22_002431 [Opisthorchis felineus]